MARLRVADLELHEDHGEIDHREDQVVDQAPADLGLLERPGSTIIKTITRPPRGSRSIAVVVGGVACGGLPLHVLIKCLHSFEFFFLAHSELVRGDRPRPVRVELRVGELCIKMMNFASQMMNFALQMMTIAFKMNKSREEM